MTKKSGLGFMMAFVQGYLDGNMDRLSFDLDFEHYLTKNFPKMEREGGELADCFAFYLSEEGVDRADGISDSAHKKLIKKQFGEFMAAMSDGIL